jgi:hypothetical protein
MMLKSLGLDPKMMENVAQAVQQAAADLRMLKVQMEVITTILKDDGQRLQVFEEKQAEILRRLDIFIPKELTAPREKENGQ